LTTVQPREHLPCHVESGTRSVDGSHRDQNPVCRVRDVPARATVRRVERDVEGAADEGERRNCTERREFHGKTVLAVWACDIVERTTFVVVCDVECGAERCWSWGRLREGTSSLGQEESDRDRSGLNWVDLCDGPGWTQCERAGFVVVVVEVLEL